MPVESSQTDDQRMLCRAALARHHQLQLCMEQVSEAPTSRRILHDARTEVRMNLSKVHGEFILHCFHLQIHANDVIKSRFINVKSTLLHMKHCLKVEFLATGIQSHV